MEAPQMTSLSLSSAPHDPAGGTLVSTDGRTLPLTAAGLTATARGGLAEVVLEQRFRNTAEVPLTVTYSFPLPGDAAVGGYVFTVGGRRIVGEIDRRRAARERFEQALIDGHTAGLVEQERSSLFTQEIGNIPPGAEVVAALTIDQPLRWLEEGAWEWRFPTTAAPRYLGAAGRVPDAGRVAQEVAEGPLSVRLRLSLALRDRASAPPQSPSHALRAVPVTGEGEGEYDVGFAAPDGVPLDRDLVVRWPAARREVGLALDVACPAAGDGAYALLTVTPPDPAARGRALARDLVVLLDTSGSMEGEPLAQARRVVSALIGTLRDEDQLELIAFSSAPARWKRRPVAATAAARREALAWLAGLQAGGSTEMRDGILEALRPLRADSQRQVVLVTDGLIGFEAEVVGAIANRLPAGSRVHTVGVGSAVNRSLTAAAARAGRGVEVLAGVGEDAEPAARRLVARTAAPLVVNLALSGSALVGHAPAALPDLFAGAPALLSLQVRPEGGEVVLQGQTAAGPWRQSVAVPPCAPGDGRRAAVRLHARERIEDLETRVAAGEGQHDAEIERLGLAYQVATRLTSWIAVSEEVTVDPGAPTRRERMPQQLPHGMSVEGLGLRSGAGGAMPLYAMASAGAPMRTRAAMMPGAPPPPAKGRSGIGGLFRSLRGGPPEAKKAAPAAEGSSGPADQDEVFFDREEEPQEAEATGAADEGQRRFQGRITLRSGDQLVVEIDVDGADLDWRPGTSVELCWPDGRRTTAPLRQRTHPGTVRAGETIRLVIELAPDEALPGEIRIAGATGTVVVVI
jgi:Ca-activated chloride channel homolog